MKTKLTQQIEVKSSAASTFRNACLASCQKILAQIKGTKAAIFAESRDTLKVQEQMLRLALNEAEALAWQTVYPHLLFPALATEKIQGVSSWNQRQRALQRTNLDSTL
jgi:hypothetical protein